MGRVHLCARWAKVLWSHLWKDKYHFALKWRILSKIACFAMEDSYRKLKCMLCNSGDLSLLLGRLCL